MRAPFSVAILLAVAVPGAAQDLTNACDAVTGIVVGQWAEYEMTAPEMENTKYQMRFAIVGTEPVNGKQHFWHEMKVATAEGTMIMQVLIPSYPYGDGDVASAVVKAEEQPAMKIPGNMLSMMQQGAGGGNVARQAAEECREAEVVGSEAVTVPAGTFETLHVRPSGGGSGDLWIALEVPFGLVKMSGPGGEEMVLLRHGMDATSSITETPREIPGMPRPRPR